MPSPQMQNVPQSNIRREDMKIIINKELLNSTDFKIS